MATYNSESLIKKLKHRHESLDEQVKGFANKLLESGSPIRRLEWADGVFDQAAELEVVRLILQWAEDPTFALESMATKAREYSESFLLAGFSNSSSQSTNMATESEARAWLEWAIIIENEI
jgi:hypothetical protein